jgi:cytochrome b6-f complex iron-sulfur subunit
MELLAGSAVCGALPGVLGACAARMRYATPEVLGDRLGVRLAEITANGLLVEDPGADLPIYVRKSAAGEFTAVSTRCMHRGCQVEPAAQKLVCPCHGSEYEFNGTVLQGPTERALTRYRVTTSNDMVYIHTTPERKP